MRAALAGGVPGPAARARRQATVVAAVGAAVPTVLAAQGMASLASDLLGFSWPVAVALAGFLELALVSSALLARAAALAGRPGGADAVAVWVVSTTSGLLAGMHELVATSAGGGSSWETDPGAFLAFAVRAVAPLVAAWLWERVLQAARAEQAERTLAEVRRDRRLLEVARAALTVRRLSEASDGRSPSPRRLRRARGRLDRAHFAAMRVTHPGTTLDSVLTAVGQVDHLPAATLVPPGLACPDTTGHVTALHAVTVAGPVAGPVRPPSVSAPVIAHDLELAGPDRQGCPDGPDTISEPDMDVPLPGCPQSDSHPAALDVALDLVRRDRTVSGSRVAAELSRCGHLVSVRTGQRLRNRAVALLDVEPGVAVEGAVRLGSPCTGRA